MRERSKASADPFSDLLQLTDAKSVIVGAYRAGGAWAYRAPPPRKIKFLAIAEGHCWLRVDRSPALKISEGDVVLLNAPRGYVVGGDAPCEPVDALNLFAGREDEILQIGNGKDVYQIGGHVHLDDASTEFFRQLLPPLVHVRAGAREAIAIRRLLEDIIVEKESALPGSAVAIAHLAHLMFVQALRAHLANGDVLESGVLRALSDRKLAPALMAMHRAPSKAWTLDELAKACAMSRTTFALYFKSVTGMAPLAYLTGWRMRLAKKALRGDTSVAELAHRLGYGSESAFSNAFKRITGIAPSAYRAEGAAR